MKLFYSQQVSRAGLIMHPFEVMEGEIGQIIEWSHKLDITYHLRRTSNGIETTVGDPYDFHTKWNLSWTNQSIDAGGYLTPKEFFKVRIL